MLITLKRFFVYFLIVNYLQLTLMPSFAFAMDKEELLRDLPRLEKIKPSSVEERDGGQLNIQVRFPTSSIYFDGHFPQFKLLPAVVQVDLVLHWCHKYLGSSLKLIKIPRVKFSRPLCPNSMIHLEASYNAEMSKISFKFQDLDKNQTCSSGNIFVEKV